MVNDIIYSSAMREKVLTGINKLADTVKVTLGPKGRNVIMYQKASLRDAEYSDQAQKGAPAMVTNDGVTIAKAIVLADPLENMGVQLLKEVASKTNDAVGDGTTTATILAQAILHEGFKNVAAGADPMSLRKGMELAKDFVVAELREMAKPIVTQEELAQVAAVSCQDKVLGKMIGEALDRVGREGVINVDDSGKPETTLQILEGIVFERGFISPLMATDEYQTTVELHNPYILMCEEKITNSQDIIPILIEIGETGRDCLIICDGIEGEALGMILRNKIEGDMNIVGVVAPLYGEGRTWRMADMAVQTGGTYITKELGLSLREAHLDMLGSAEHVKVTRKQTIITGAKGDPEAIASKIKELRYMVANTDYDFNKKRFEERLAKFVSGVVKIDVGGRTEIEIWERKMRVEDAVNAASAAREEGIVAGGGIALLNVIPKLKAYCRGLEGDVRTGARIVLASLSAPAEQIAENAGLDGTAVVERLLEEGHNIGFDLDTERYVDMVGAGIVDPVKVTRLSLAAAVSVAETLLTAEVGLTEHVKKKDVFDATNIK